MSRDRKGKNGKKNSRTKSREKRRIQSERLQARVQAGQERSQGKSKNILKENPDVSMWRPKDGSHIVDVVPYLAGKSDPFVKKGDPTYTFEYWAHTRVGPNEGMYLCPAEMYNKPCPICEERQRLREKGVSDDIWKKLFPKRRNLYNVICYDKGEEKKGVQIWDVSYHYFEKLVLAISKKPSRRGGKEKLINFADPVDGRSISFSVEPAKSKNDYPKYVGHSFDERDYEVDDEILDAAFTLDDEVIKADYDEISEAYWGGKDKEEEGKKRSHKDDKDDDEKEEVSGNENEDELEDLLDEVEDLEDMDELKEFIEENDLDVKVKRKDEEEEVKEKIVEALEDKFEKESDIPF